MMQQFNFLFILCGLCASTILSGQAYEIYVSDVTSNPTPSAAYKIYKYDQNGENGEVFIDKELSWPQDILFMEEENTVLISNFFTGRITKYNAETGEYLGDFATGAGSPTRMKVRNDTLYVLQWQGNGKVLRYTLDGTALGEFTNIGIVTGIGIDWDTDDNMYVSAYGRQGNPPLPPRVRWYDSEGKLKGDFVNRNELNGPTNIWFDKRGTGDLLLLDYNAGNVKRFSSTGDYLGQFITGLSSPEGVDFLPNGNILIGNGDTGSVKMYDNEGTFIKDLIASGAAGLLRPNAVILRPTNSVATLESAEETTAILPNVGTVFYLDSSMLQEIQAIEIYSTTGKLIQQNKLQDPKIWTASGYAEGYYFVLLRTNDGRLLRQKILVKE